MRTVAEAVGEVGKPARSSPVVLETGEAQVQVHVHCSRQLGECALHSTTCEMNHVERWCERGCGAAAHHGTRSLLCCCKRSC